MKAVLNVKFSDEKMKMIENLGYSVEYVSEKDLKYRKDLYDMDVWFTYTGFDFVEMEKLNNLKYVHLTSTGFNQVPVEFLSDNNIILSNNKTGYAVPMAESIVMYILEVYKNSNMMFKQQQEKTWKLDMSWIELAGKKVGFLGTGNIAKEAAKRLKAFDVEVWGVNTNGREIEYFDKCFSLSDSDDFFKECDVVIGLMPATEETYQILGEEKFELMKDGSVLMNIGRGNLLDEEALIKYMSKFKGVVLDVVHEEPLERDNKLWDFENIIITPHNSWVSEINKERLFNTLYNNLKSYIETNEPVYRVENITRGY